MNYSIKAKLMHWIMGFIIMMMLVIGYSLDDVPIAYKSSFYYFHKSIGILVGVLVIIRLFMRFTNKYPSLPSEVPIMLVYAAKINIIGLYLMMIFMPLSGVLMSIFAGYAVPFWGLFEISALEVNKQLSHFFHETHEVCGAIFVFLIFLHILGGLFHHFILKDNVLKRMFIKI